MKHQPIFAIAGLMAALSLSLVAPSVDAQQGRRGNQNNQGNQNGPGGFGGPGAQGSPFNMMQVMSLGSNLIDPAQTAKATLVYRPEVQNTLALDLKQQNALDALKNAQAQNQQKMVQDLRAMMQGNRNQNQAQGQNQQPTSDQREQQRQELTEKAKGLAQGYQDDMLKRIDEILTPKQRKRLTELDLRWRGPLALVDPKVAEQAQLGDEDKQKVQAAYKEFTTARRKLIEGMLPPGLNRFVLSTPAATGAAAEDGAAPAATPPTPPAQPSASLSPQERQLAQKKALVDFEKNRIALGNKLVANVTPTAATTWEGMIGARFIFRNNDL